MTDGVGFDIVGHLSLTTAAESVRNFRQVILIGQTSETTIEYSSLTHSEVAP